jgi:formylglycine-generating enzyme required for sulfatase activity
MVLYQQKWRMYKGLSMKAAIKKSILLMIFGLTLISVHAQRQNCYEVYRVKGIATYNVGNYAKAKAYFAGALNACVSSDIPANNDIDSLIKKCEEQEQWERDLNLEMVFVQGGTFTMGCTPEQGNECYDYEKPVHQVTLSDFWIGKYEVTQSQWKVVMGINPGDFNGDNLPVENVNWKDVQEFLSKLNQKTGRSYRLPTEAEWEYAARGGSKSREYKYSGSDIIGDVAWYYHNSRGNIHPVGQKQANELGIYDMSGNVLEWCSDFFGNYSSKSQINPNGPSSGFCRMIRGSYYYADENSCRIAYRSYVSPGYPYYGCRVACSSQENEK